MKQRHLAALAAFLVGVMGGAAFGDDHGGGPIVGPQENCSNYPWWCWGQCAELNACRSGNTPIGGSNCAIEEANLRSCETSQPPYVPPVIVVPPPACPAGQHFTEGGQCHADHVCGDNEIGGGSEECETCTEGSAPNAEGTACVAECGWDQIADAAGKCVLRPFDDNAKALAARVSNCGAPTVASYLDHSLVSSVSYGLPKDKNHYGTAGCNPPGNNPPTSLYVKLNRASLEKSSDGRYSSVWHWATTAVIHEFTHVRDFVEYDRCTPWYTSKGFRAVTAAGYSSDVPGFEEWTVERTDEEYRTTFGVRSPYDPEYRSRDHNKPLPCLFD